MAETQKTNFKQITQKVKAGHFNTLEEFFNKK